MATKVKARKAAEDEEESKLITVPEAAAMLRLERTTVYRLVKKGKLTPIFVTDDTIRLSRAEVEQIVNSQMPKVPK